MRTIADERAEEAADQIAGAREPGGEQQLLRAQLRIAQDRSAGERGGDHLSDRGQHRHADGQHERRVAMDLPGAADVEDGFRRRHEERHQEEDDEEQPGDAVAAAGTAARRGRR